MLKSNPTIKFDVLFYKVLRCEDRVDEHLAVALIGDGTSRKLLYLLEGALDEVN